MATVADVAPVVTPTIVVAGTRAIERLGIPSVVLAVVLSYLFWIELGSRDERGAQRAERAAFLAGLAANTTTLTTVQKDAEETRRQVAEIWRQLPPPPREPQPSFFRPRR